MQKTLAPRLLQVALHCTVWGLAIGIIDNTAVADDGRLLATGGGSQIEGSAGGGIVPMAVLAGYGAEDQHGGTAFVSHVQTRDYKLDVFGAAWSWNNRVEVSAARQELYLNKLADALGVTDNTIAQNIFGVKVRLAGDLVYSQLPQISVGAQYKVNEDFFIPHAAGARDDSDYDLYIAASKLFLGDFFGHNILINGVARSTRANQGGLVGFGGDKNNNREVVFEGSTAIFLNRYWAVGGEYRQMPDNLSFAKADDWRDVFIGWFPNKQWSVIGAWVDLGAIATLKNQQGWYVSLQGSF
ncbi:MAG TPA: DUF3034 family protein [Spongiibacteraceae bacterium]|nr:DUF3034 family protein [Spongiibacteraceae bacterium]